MIRLISRFVVIALLCSGVSSAQGTRGLLEPTPMQPPEGLRDGPSINVLRTRTVTVSTDLLEPGDSVRLDLFDDVRLTARKVRRVDRGPGNFSWFGNLEGQNGTVILVVYGDGLLMGHISTDDRGFTITHGGQGIHSVKEIDRYGFADEGDDAEPVGPSLNQPPGRGFESDPPPPVETQDDGSIIDVMVVISDGVLDTWPPATQEQDADAFAQLGVDITNDGYARSDVNQRLRLVSRRTVAYDDPANSSSTVLGDLRDPNDGEIDIIHAWRDECAADIVSFWVLGYSDPSICGRGYIMSNPGAGFESNAFNTVHEGCVQFYFSFGHELGHNMGCRHNHDGSDSPYPFCHGYQDPGGQFRTTLAYNCDPSCPRRNQFSNPDVYYGGEGVDCSGNPPPPGCLVTGTTADNDCARTMDLTAPIVAAFRDSADGSCVTACSSAADCDDNVFCNGEEFCVEGDCQPGIPPSCDDGVACTLDACDGDLDICIHTAQDNACDDGAWCNGAETCDEALGCQDGTAPDCDDSVDCTTDACNETLDACDHTPDDGACDDGTWCNGAETCDAAKGCETGPAPDCEDRVGCTVDTCNEGTDSCDHTPDHAVCDDGSFCNGAEVCDPELDCQVGLPMTCDDGIDCTTDICTHDQCYSRDSCRGSEACHWSTGQCEKSCQTQADCDDGIDCTFDKCLFDITQPGTGFCKYANHCN